MSLLNSGLNPIEKAVMQKLANCPDLQHLPLSEVVLVAGTVMRMYRQHLTEERNRHVQAGGFEKDM